MIGACGALFNLVDERRRSSLHLDHDLQVFGLMFDLAQAVELLDVFISLLAHYLVA